MTKMTCWILVNVLAILSCATIAEQTRLARFDEVSDGYRRALLMSDFRAAAQFIDPADRHRTDDADQYELLKVFNYEVLRADVSEDHRKVEQDVRLEYFRLNVNRLKRIEYHQIWVYREEHKIWLLQTDLPKFEH